jgi:uncharacterized protein YjbI with pentapeptide repeats
MGKGKQKHGTDSSSWLKQELVWVIWLGAAIVLIVALLFSKPISTWLENWAFIKILDALSKLGVLIAVMAFLLEIPKQEDRAQAEKKKAHFEYWRAIDDAAAAGIQTSYARKIALENLASVGVSLRNIDAPNAELRGINLTGADLVGANLRQADLTGAILDEADLSKSYLYRARLYGASLRGANLESVNLGEVLYDERTQFPEGFNPAEAGAYLIAPHASISGVTLPKAVFWGVNLQGANLQAGNFTEAGFHGAILKDANFEGANLQGARFQEAQLEGANFKDADLKGASFWRAKGITVEQIKEAQNWDKAEYSKEFCEKLGLSSKSISALPTSG